MVFFNSNEYYVYQFSGKFIVLDGGDTTPLDFKATLAVNGDYDKEPAGISNTFAKSFAGQVRKSYHLPRKTPILVEIHNVERVDRP
jgi:hypothetical protein